MREERRKQRQSEFKFKGLGGKRALQSELTGKANSDFPQGIAVLEGVEGFKCMIRPRKV